MATLDDLLSVLQGASNSAASTVSAPVDGINWILKKAGFPVSDKPVGGSDWLKDKGLMADPKNQNLGYVGEAIGGVLPMVAAAKAPQIASALNQMGANMAAPRTLNPQTGAIVWHGSPHKFDKFDSSKIGTGEGAQAYGHGIYTAENPAVAAEYQNTLRDIGFSYDGQKIDRLKQPVRETAAKLLHESKGDMNAAVKAADRYAYDDLLKRELATMDPSKVSVGNLYKVDLPDEHIAKMLDWDKPLSQQAPEVQRLFDSSWNKEITGKEAHSYLAAELGSAGLSPENRYSQTQVASWLSKNGIPGIRYLDGGSRGTGAGTSNFVVFPGNENLLRILERNGIPLD